MSEERKEEAKIPNKSTKLHPLIEKIVNLKRLRYDGKNKSTMALCNSALKLIESVVKHLKSKSESRLSKLYDSLDLLHKHFNDETKDKFLPNVCRRFEQYVRSEMERNETKIDWDVVDNAVQDLQEEIETSYDLIAEQAPMHIHQKEVILTCGCSTSVSLFLEKVHSQQRDFQVFCAESAPNYEGHLMAKRLAKAGINTTLISDSSVFALMQRVNKVIVGTHTVLADGGLLSHAGLYGLCLAAKFHSVPVVVLAPLLKFSNIYAFDQDTLNVHGPPSILPYEKFDRKHVKFVKVQNPLYDYVPPHYVSFYVTNHGSHSPFEIKRIINEYYPRENLINSLMELSSYSTVGEDGQEEES